MLKKILLIILLSSITYTLYSENKVLYGNASWYGEKFHGRKTANGEIYNMHKMTAAHKKLPFGTYLRVTNLQNNISVIVKVNDRGPFVPNRILDVSKAAAQKLMFINQGLARVKIEIIGKYYDIDNQSNLVNNEPNINEINQPPSQIKEESTSKEIKAISNPNNFNTNQITPNSSRVIIIKTHEVIKKNKNTIYKIQLGAYYNLEYAVQQQKKFESNGFTTILCTYSGEGKTFRILTKKTFKSKHEANEINKTLKGKGIHAFVVEL